MSTDQVLDEIVIQPKVYSQRMVGLGAFFGGPFGAGYLLATNYKALGQEEKVGITWAMAILGMLVYTGTAVVINYYVYDFPDSLFCFLSYGVARMVYQKEQAEAIKQYIEQGGTLHSGWQVFKMVMIIFFTLFAIAMFVEGIFFLINKKQAIPPPPPPPQIQIPEQDPNSGITSAFYGGLEHVVGYDRAQWSIEEIDALGAHFISIGYFNQSVQRQVYAEKIEGAYLFSMVEVASRAEDPAIQAIYKGIKYSLEQLLNSSEVQLILVDETWDREFVWL